MKFEHLLSPMQVGNKTYRNRVVSAPMAFSLIVQNPEAQGPTYRKLESSAKGGNACVIVGELDVNFKDAVRIPGFRYVDFSDPEQDPQTFDAVSEYAIRVKSEKWCKMPSGNFIQGGPASLVNMSARRSAVKATAGEAEPVT